MYIILTFSFTCAYKENCFSLCRKLIIPSQIFIGSFFLKHFLNWIMALNFPRRKPRGKMRWAKKHQPCLLFVRSTNVEMRQTSSKDIDKVKKSELVMQSFFYPTVIFFLCKNIRMKSMIFDNMWDFFWDSKLPYMCIIYLYKYQRNILVIKFFLKIQQISYSTSKTWQCALWNIK